MTVQTDSQGRLYLSSELRKRYGEQFHVVEYDDRLELIPIDEDPLGAVRDEIGDSLDSASIETLRNEAHERARREAKRDIEQTTERPENTAE